MAHQAKIAPKRQIVLVSLLVFAIAAGISGFLLEQNKKAKASGVPANGTWKLEILRKGYYKSEFEPIRTYRADHESRVLAVEPVTELESGGACYGIDDIDEPVEPCIVKFDIKRGDRIRLTWDFSASTTTTSRCFGQGNYFPWGINAPAVTKNPTDINSSARPKSGSYTFGAVDSSTTVDGFLVVNRGTYEMSIRCSEPDPTTGLYNVDTGSGAVWQSGKFIITIDEPIIDI